MMTFKGLTLGGMLYPCIIVGGWLNMTGQALAQKDDAASNHDECIIRVIKASKVALTIEQIEQQCSEDLPGTHFKKGRIAHRIISEQRTEFDPYVITPHRMNYILPVSYSSKINKAAYRNSNNWGDYLDNAEAKFQLSIKVPLNKNKIFTRGDGLFFGFTLKSWWQVYSDNISKPFRETNYQPEFFYFSPLKYHPFEGNTGIVAGVEHQSNGRANDLSRSWNRAYVNLLFEKGNLALSLQPWWRIPESEKKNALDTKGDDNPDILDFMGHFQLTTVYKWQQYELSLEARQNFSTRKGAVEFGFTFPLWGKLRGYCQYTNGYGESLIDYNHSQQRIGLGLALTNVL